jgi:glycerophosphoryl diester phosphodiesterase
LVLLTGEKTTNMESIDWCIEQHISFDGYYPLVTQEMIDKLHENNLTANVWTVNDEENGQKFKDMNVDFITTDILTK